MMFTPSVEPQLDGARAPHLYLDTRPASLVEFTSAGATQNDVPSSAGPQAEEGKVLQPSWISMTAPSDHEFFIELRAPTVLTGAAA